MPQHITIDKAISRGHLMVNLPVFICLLGFPGLALLLSYKQLIAKQAVLFALFIGFVASWLVWSFMITKWRVWAYKHVLNIHGLKDRAIKEKLIWNDGSIFEKTEIRTKREQQIIDAFENKLKSYAGQFEDESLPNKTNIYFRHKFNSSIVAICTILIVITIFIMSRGYSPLLLFICLALIFSAFTLLNLSRNSTNKKPQMIIDS